VEQNQLRRVEHQEKVHLVDPLSSCIPGFWINVCRLSKGHSGDLVLDVQLEASAEFYHICHKLHSAISPPILQQFSWSQWLPKALEKTF